MTGHVGHFVAAWCVTLILGLLLLGWRDRRKVDIGDQLAAVFSIFAGMLFGVGWKLVEFILDWVRYSDLQKSNSETMLDLLWNDLGAVVGAVLAARLYCHVLSGRRRAQLGEVAGWLIEGPSRVLDRHGVLVIMVLAGVATLMVAGLWFAGRPMPGFGNG